MTERDGDTPGRGRPHRAPDAARREALRKLGKYAAYTAPAMLAMLKSEQAVAQTGA